MLPDKLKYCRCWYRKIYIALNNTQGNNKYTIEKKKDNEITIVVLKCKIRKVSIFVARKKNKD